VKKAVIKKIAVGKGGGGVAHERDQAVGRSKFCQNVRGCAHGGSWRERDASSVTEETLPRQAMGEDTAGGGVDRIEGESKFTHSQTGYSR